MEQAHSGDELASDWALMVEKEAVEDAMGTQRLPFESLRLGLLFSAIACSPHAEMMGLCVYGVSVMLRLIKCAKCLCWFFV